MPKPKNWSRLQSLEGEVKKRIWKHDRTNAYIYVMDADEAPDIHGNNDRYIIRMEASGRTHDLETEDTIEDARKEAVRVMNEGDHPCPICGADVGVLRSHLELKHDVKEGNYRLG